LAAQIFRTCADLFRLGPETLVLTGAWCETEESQAKVIIHA